MIKTIGKFSLVLSICILPVHGLASQDAGDNVVIDDSKPGTLVHYPSFPSDLVEPRPVDVWLPDGYEESDSPYPVIYMHDGQFMFDRPTSPYASTWERTKGLIYGGVFWNVDETMARLVAKKQIRPTIVVSVWNNDLRSPEGKNSGDAPTWSNRGYTQNQRFFILGTCF